MQFGRAGSFHRFDVVCSVARIAIGFSAGRRFLFINRSLAVVIERFITARNKKRGVKRSKKLTLK